MNVFEAALSMQWAMTEDALRNLLAIASRSNTLTPDALAAELGRPLEQTARASVRDGVGILTIRGPLFRYANLFTRISGATSYEQTALDFNVLLHDPSVRGILLNVDSPGGEVNGCNELAEMIFNARGMKPVWAYVGGIGASGGYWLSSAADRVIIDETSILGSVGVIAAFLDDSKAMEKAGLAEIVIVSSQSPHKHTDPATDDGHGRIQVMLDRLADVFIGKVARNRKIEAAAVVDEFGKGWVKIGQEAVDAGLADGLGSFESVVAELSEKSRQRSDSLLRNLNLATAGTPAPGGLIRTPTPEATMPDATQPTPAAAAPVITKEYLVANHAALVAELRAEGRAEGVEAGATAERTRILAIEEHAAAGHADLTLEAKKDPTCTVEMYALRVIKAENAVGSQVLAGLKAGETASGQPKSTARTDDAAPEAEQDSTKPRAARDVKQENVQAIVTAGRAAKK